MKYVYLVNIEGTSVYKIGFTKQSPERRLKNLQTGNPYKMVLVDSYKSNIAPNIESVMHSYFKHKKNNPEEGLKLLGEWFMLDKSDIEAFKDTCQMIEGNLKALGDSTMFY
jgi:hypothetical protein